MSVAPRTTPTSAVRPVSGGGIDATSSSSVATDDTRQRASSAPTMASVETAPKRHLTDYTDYEQFKPTSPCRCIPATTSFGFPTLLSFALANAIFAWESIGANFRSNAQEIQQGLNDGSLAIARTFAVSTAMMFILLVITLIHAIQACMNSNNESHHYKRAYQDLFKKTHGLED